LLHVSRRQHADRPQLGAPRRRLQLHHQDPDPDRRRAADRSVALPGDHGRRDSQSLAWRNRMLTELRARVDRRDEQGSIVIAMAVIMVLGLLSIATLSRSMSNTVNVRRTQDFNSALSAADSGLSDALYQIDQEQTATFTRTGGAGLGTWS